VLAPYYVARSLPGSLSRSVAGTENPKSRGRRQRGGKSLRQHEALGGGSTASGELFQQRLRLLQIFGVKPFGEPVINLR
jgi:hypothetical protein